MFNPLIKAKAYRDFEEASKDVLALLKERTGFSMWMTTRTVEPNWIVLSSLDDYYGVRPGTVFRWKDSFCSRMILGGGPNFAPVSREITAYLEAPIGQQVQIQAYIGVPIFTNDGRLFGTLCAIDPKPVDHSLENEMPLVNLLANMLGALASRELEMHKQARAIDTLRKEAETDSLTGLLNRRGWDSRLKQEESRGKRYGSPISILLLDLDRLKETNDRRGHQAGDQLIKAAAECLHSSVRRSDIVARLGGDEFAVLAVETDDQGAEALRHHVATSFQEKGIEASIGCATHDPTETLGDTTREADLAMYECKREKQLEVERCD